MYYICNSPLFKVTCWSCALGQIIISLKFVIFVRWPLHIADHGCCVSVCVLLLYRILHSFPCLRLTFKYLFFIYKGFSVSKVPPVINIIWEVVSTLLHIIYFTQILLFFNIITKHIDIHDPSWHKYKNFFMVEISLLHSQPFIRSHFHLSVSQVWIQWPA
jgi:hypothetical protein